MAILLRTVQVKNVSSRAISVKANPRPQSPILPTTGDLLKISAQRYIEVEEDRVDEEQLDNFRRKNLVVLTKLTRLIEEGGSTGSGSE